VHQITRLYMKQEKKACQRSPVGAKMWNSHISVTYILIK